MLQNNAIQCQQIGKNTKYIELGKVQRVYVLSDSFF